MNQKQIDDHWEYHGGLFKAQEDDSGEPAVIGIHTAEYLYKSALVHGAKHKEQELQGIIDGFRSMGSDLSNQLDKAKAEIEQLRHHLNPQPDDSVEQWGDGSGEFELAPDDYPPRFDRDAPRNECWMCGEVAEGKVVNDSFWHGCYVTTWDKNAKKFKGTRAPFWLCNDCDKTCYQKHEALMPDDLRPTETPPSAFGRALERARKDKRMTLRELAKYVDTTIGYLTDLEHDRAAPPPVDMILKMEQALDIKGNYLVSLAVDRYRFPPDTAGCIDHEKEEKPTHHKEVCQRCGKEGKFGDKVVLAGKPSQWLCYQCRDFIDDYLEWDDYLQEGCSIP
jgi:transcriptional regulator with XRE-family HTH domain